MNQILTSSTLAIGLLICKLNAEYSIEDWLDLSSDLRLFSYDKEETFSPVKPRLIPLLPDQLFFDKPTDIPYTISVSRSIFPTYPKCYGQLSDLLLHGTANIDFRFKTLSLLAKILIEYPTELRMYDLHPSKIHISTTPSEISVTFSPIPMSLYKKSMNEYTAVMCMPKGIPQAFAYLMFYVMYPDSRDWIDENEVLIRERQFCHFEPEEGWVKSYPYAEQDPTSPTDNEAFFCPFELCAISLFSENITMEDVVTYLDDWKNFNTVYSALKESLRAPTYWERAAARSTIERFASYPFSQLAQKTLQRAIRLSKLFSWIEEESDLERYVDYESKFLELTAPNEDDKKRFANYIRILSNLYDNEEFQISYRTFIRIERLSIYATILYL